MSCLGIGVERTSDSGRGLETTKILVAKRDLPVQTKLDSKELDNLLTWADMPRNLVPPDAVVNLEDVKEKELNRTLKRGQPVAYSDLGAGCCSGFPEGQLQQMTFRSTQVDAVAGFVRPGSKVDVMYVERTSSGKARAGIILQNMLVLAVNLVDRLQGGAEMPKANVESISLAMNARQARMLALAEDRGKLKLVLQGNDKKSNTAIAKSAAGENEVEWLDEPFDAPAVKRELKD